MIIAKFYYNKTGTTNIECGTIRLESLTELLAFTKKPETVKHQIRITELILDALFPLIDDITVMDLQEALSQVTAISLINSTVVTAVAKTLAKWLTENRKLISLTLSGSIITDDAAAIIAAALKRNNTIRTIDLTQSAASLPTKITSEGICMLGKALHHRTTPSVLITQFGSIASHPAIPRFKFIPDPLSPPITTNTNPG